MGWKKYKLKDLVDNFSIRARDYGGSEGLEFLGVSNEDGITGSKYAAEDKSEDYKIIEKGCFAYNPYRINVGSIGYLGQDIKGLISPAYVIFKTKPNSIYDALLFKFLKSAEGLRQIKFHARGTVRQALRFEDLGKIEISLPTYEKQFVLLEKFQLVERETSNLNMELTNQLSLVKQLRQAFLSEAMQGKLALAPSPLERAGGEEETGQQLLARIKAEKAHLIKDKKLKKDPPAGRPGKELPPIKPGDISFEIPKDWVWCRLGEIIYNTESGKSPNCVNQSVDGDDWGVIKTTAVQEMVFLENENKILPNGFAVQNQHKIVEGDVLITRAGPKNRVGIVCCVENLSKNLILSDKTIRILHSKSLLNSKFIALTLNSEPIKKRIEAKMTGMADSQVNISQDNIKGFLFPLPPLSIQNQIVAKLDELMKTCDDLEISIKQSQIQNEQLLQQVLKEALEVKNP